MQFGNSADGIFNAEKKCRTQPADCGAPDTRRASGSGADVRSDRTPVLLPTGILSATPTGCSKTTVLGRAHHRVLHFVSRRPGLTIAELLDILKITKQSLNRVLKELRDEGYVEVRAGAIDRRQRQLFPTKTGVNLALSIAKLQTQRFRRVFGHLQKNARPRHRLPARHDRPARTGESRNPGGFGHPAQIAWP